MQDMDPAATATRLVPDCEDLDRLVRQTEILMTALDDDEDIGVKRLLLPDPIVEAHDAFDKVTWALVDHTDAVRSPFISLPSPSRPRMLAPDGRYEHMPFRLVPLPAGALDLLAAALDEINQALDDRAIDTAGRVHQHMLEDLREVLTCRQLDVVLGAQYRQPNETRISLG